jgi:hypothetical protein
MMFIHGQKIISLQIKKGGGVCNVNKKSKCGGPFLAIQHAVKYDNT